MNNNGIWSIYKGVRVLRTLLTLLLAVAWLPLTEHCQLESITGLEILRCESNVAEGAADGSHCDDVACCDWESGSLPATAESNRPSMFPLVALVAPDVTAAEAEAPAESHPVIACASQLKRPRAVAVFFARSPTGARPFIGFLICPARDSFSFAV